MKCGMRWLFDYFANFLKTPNFPKKKDYELPPTTLKLSHQRPLKTQKYSVRIGLSYSGFSFYKHFNRQFTYPVFFIFKTVRCVIVKRFCTNTWLFLALLGTASPLKTFYMSLNITKHLRKYKPPDSLNYAIRGVL